MLCSRGQYPVPTLVSLLQTTNQTYLNHDFCLKIFWDFKLQEDLFLKNDGSVKNIVLGICEKINLMKNDSNKNSTSEIQKNYNWDPEEQQEFQ
jgi:hypothetical protein